MVYLAAVAAFASGCAVSKKRVVPPGQVRPALEATKDQLLAQYNQQGRAIQSLSASVNLVPTAGSTYSGVIEEYHDVNGFVLAKRPAFIRVIGQAPVVAKDVFDMVSDGENFRIFIPSKHKFIVGSTAMARPAKKPIENLRPQHLLDAFFWPEIPPGATVLFEEGNAAPDRFYILTLVHKEEIERKIWFDRANLSIARLGIYASDGRLVSDIRYSDWQPVEGVGGVHFAKHIWLARPHDDYQLEIRITKLAVNETIPADRFQLAQPPGTELVHLAEGAEESHP
jgi:outer membrane lipoprotein-sorting protein